MTRRGGDDFGDLDTTSSTDDFYGETMSFSTSDSLPDSLGGMPSTPAAPAAPAAPSAGIVVQCPSCQTKLKVTDQTRPITIACPSCQTKLKLQ